MLGMAGRKEPGVLLELGGALADSGELREAEQVFATAFEQSRELGEENLAARASIELSFNHVLVDPTVPLSEMLRVAEECGEHVRAWRRRRRHRASVASRRDGPLDSVSRGRDGARSSSER